MLTRLLPYLVLGLSCGAATGQTLSVWVHSGPGPERDAYIASTKAFNEAQTQARDPVRAEIVPLPESEYNEAVNKAARERKLPCVLEFDGPNVAAYASAGHLVPLDRFEGLLKIRDSMLNSLVRQGTVDGTFYSVGQYDSGLALWGNRELLQRIGARIPSRTDDAWTLAELEEILKKLKATGVASPLDMKFNYGMGEWFTYGFAPIVQGFGGDLIERQSLRTARGTLNSSPSVKGLATLQGWIRQGYVDASPADNKSFVSGRSALSWVGHWVHNEYKAALGDKLVLMPLPRFGAKTVTGSGSWNFGIAATCPQPAAAAKFLEHLMSRAEILRVTEANGAVPGTGAAMVYSKTFAPGGALRLYADQLLAGQARVRPASPHYPVISRSFAQAINDVAKGADPQRALDEAAAKIDQHIAGQVKKAP